VVNKRGYSFGPDLPIHYEQRIDGWAVFDARDDRDLATGLAEHEAFTRAMKENGASPNAADLDAFDTTP
jgi:hypothetical protein